MLENLIQHVPAEEYLQRSRWYGPNLITFLTTSEETGGAFSLLRFTLRKGFGPPLHVHTREEESSLILSGEIIYEVGERTIHTKAGDYIHLPREVPHKFRVISDTAELLLFITPGGFEEMFRQSSHPAESLDMPPVTAEKPDRAFFEKIRKINEDLGATFLPEF